MSLFARSDLMSVSIPVTSGGCNSTHTRPVRNGVPVKDWELACPSCEAYLKGDGKRQILKNIPGDKENGIPQSQQRVPDADPHWGSTRDTIPQTPDQQKVYHLQIKRGEQQLRALESIATLAKAGIDIRTHPDALFFLREQELPEVLLQGAVVCPAGHDNAAGVKFCGECGIAMNEQKEITAQIPLGRLHVATLRKMCREKNLPDKGTKDEMVMRLEAA